MRKGKLRSLWYSKNLDDERLRMLSCNKCCLSCHEPDNTTFNFLHMRMASELARLRITCMKLLNGNTNGIVKISVKRSLQRAREGKKLSNHLNNMGRKFVTFIGSVGVGRSTVINALTHTLSSADVKTHKTLSKHFMG